MKPGKAAATDPEGDRPVMGLVLAVVIPAVILSACLALVAACGLLDLRVPKLKTITVIPTRPPVIAATWLTKEELAAVPAEELAALYTAEARDMQPPDTTAWLSDRKSDTPVNPAQRPSYGPSGQNGGYVPH
jgi:hypothetical protein